MVPHHSTFSINRLDRFRESDILSGRRDADDEWPVNSDHAIRYFASVLRCGECSLKQRCCRNTPARRIVRDINEAARDIARGKMKAKAFLKSLDQRKRVEMRFAHLKTHHRFERLRLRGLSGARDEFHLAAIVQNLKTMALRLLAPQSRPTFA